MECPGMNLSCYEISWYKMSIPRTSSPVTYIFLTERQRQAFKKDTNLPQKLY